MAREPVVRFGDAVSVRVRPRSVAVVAVLLAGIAAVAVLGLMTGDFALTLGEVLGSLAGRGPGGVDYVVLDLRLPRVLAAVLVGAALGVSGAVFQSLSRNPLGSPDIIGFSAGSATGAIIVLIGTGGGLLAIAGGSVLGGVAAAVLVYALAYRGGVAGYRLVLIGIGVSAVLASVNTFVLTRAGLRQAQAAQVWLVGSLNGRGWDQVLLLACAVAVLLPLAVLLGRNLALLEMGDGVAAALGVRPERSRLALVVVSVALVAVSTACAGPIGFVALAAPQVARRLCRSAGPALVGSAATGAFLLLASDVGSQRLFGTNTVPVGIATAAVGGVYLAWLLTGEWRRGRR
ncbi:FecCD family ABC transporter permease [Actinokineospora pegani]|uniref:FecCD family ABC transporter permease n=1 Tax=Actinokineospora pegani TaxID=2654637 RepID=UPI001F2F2986|nr:iron chelate uptake ABC transporter family permease subunit [Actinokineospora pegani]